MKRGNKSQNLDVPKRNRKITLTNGSKDSVAELVNLSNQWWKEELFGYFKQKGYEFTSCCRHKKFRIKEPYYCGEIDFLLENGDFACLIEVKTNLSVDDVKDHIEKLGKYRIDADGRGDNRRFLAAVGGGFVRENVRKFAQREGMFVVQQSGDNVEILVPEGKPKVW